MQRSQLRNVSASLEKLLGEGGFSFVYLVRDLSSDRLYALKKILVTSGQEGVKEAMREVEAYRRFQHPNIIRILGSAVVQDESGEGTIIYLFLPYYSRGNLQNAMGAASVTGNRMSERKILELFHGTCLAVRAMHHYRLPKVPATYPPTQEDNSIVGEMVFEHDEELFNSDQGELVPYAHRDIKPANVMIDDDGKPILMDFGSTINEHSSMPYRAPELFDVKTGIMLDEKCDIWSLGCTLYAVVYGHSPFEVEGQSIAMAAGSGRYRHPEGCSQKITYKRSSI
ncbi:uncharacterized protein L203_100489 [Cryptococcus depauperatus CBS 7841]|uniref:non-specific serine/threonine protein kinase n=1 Tax=Cryptococcus depauperatus CBS 7841 TaxID=1295531 RepID=A0AAJ8JN67_9TREE